MRIVNCFILKLCHFNYISWHHHLKEKKKRVRKGIRSRRLILIFFFFIYCKNSTVTVFYSTSSFSNMTLREEKGEGSGLLISQTSFKEWGLLLLPLENYHLLLPPQLLSFPEWNAQPEGLFSIQSWYWRSYAKQAIRDAQNFYIGTTVMCPTLLASQ